MKDCTCWFVICRKDNEFEAVSRMVEMYWLRFDPLDQTKFQLLIEYIFRFIDES